MKLECDYTAKYLEEKKQIDQAVDTPLSEEEHKMLNLMLELEEVRASQYTRSINTDRQDRLIHEFYPFLRELAKSNGARVELDVDEEKMTARVHYACYDAIFLNDGTFPGLSMVKEILAASNDITVSVEEDGLIRVALHFCLYDAVKTKDHSQEIAAIKEKMRRFKSAKTDGC